ncbi:TetR/AcrR family transcriptional regulator [Pelomonas sp. KK5]|uniref:TetR/AcrR family transcriptional regulator n=1 Tax=Pelomonas sp. KK5 TaxID=1855730 RepID=UPI0018E954C3|nr:TetR/AcrR family transcriptional regulator [Pelomonas sp. KK5]
MPAENVIAKRPYDADQSMADILRVATSEFANKGFSGARVDEIAAATRTSKRMIYYHFGSKEGLYVAVLEEAYRTMREAEAGLELDDLEPEDALRKLVGFTFDRDHENEDFIRLVMNENIHRAEYIARSDSIQKTNIPAISKLQEVYERGVKAKVFRRGIDPIDLHMSISALCFFNVSNRHTFSVIFDRKLETTAVHSRRRDSIVEMVVRFVRK